MKRCPQCNRVETDDALAFCRADGTALVSDSSPPDREAGTARLGTASEPSEIETSILPQTTDAAISRSTAPPTVLPAQPSGTTHALSKSKRRKAIAAVGALIVVALIVGAYLYWPRTKKAGPIESIAVMPFVNQRTWMRRPWQKS